MILLDLFIKNLDFIRFLNFYEKMSKNREKWPKIAVFSKNHEKWRKSHSGSKSGQKFVEKIKKIDFLPCKDRRTKLHRTLHGRKFAFLDNP